MHFASVCIRLMNPAGSAKGHPEVHSSSYTRFETNGQNNSSARLFVFFVRNYWALTLLVPPHHYESDLRLV
jgi:hypothetical protein